MVNRSGAEGMQIKTEPLCRTKVRYPRAKQSCQLNELATEISLNGQPCRYRDRRRSDLSNGACLVADIYLPEMTGVQLSETLAHSGRFLPTILVSARLDEKTRFLASRINPVALLAKPFRRDELITAIDSALHCEATKV